MDQYMGIPLRLVRVYPRPIISLQLLAQGGALSTVVTTELQPGSVQNSYNNNWSINDD